MLNNLQLSFQDHQRQIDYLKRQHAHILNDTNIKLYNIIKLVNKLFTETSSSKKLITKINIQLIVQRMTHHSHCLN